MCCISCSLVQELSTSFSSEQRPPEASYYGNVSVLLRFGFALRVTYSDLHFFAGCPYIEVPLRCGSLAIGAGLSELSIFFSEDDCAVQPVLVEAGHQMVSVPLLYGGITAAWGSGQLGTFIEEVDRAVQLGLLKEADLLPFQLLIVFNLISMCLPARCDFVVRYHGPLPSDPLLHHHVSSVSAWSVLGVVSNGVEVRTATDQVRNLISITPRRNT